MSRLQLDFDSIRAPGRRICPNNVCVLGIDVNWNNRVQPCPGSDRCAPFRADAQYGFYRGNARGDFAFGKDRHESLPHQVHSDLGRVPITMKDAQ